MNIEHPPICLSVAGSDPSGGAGIQLDSRVFSALGCYPTSIPAVLTIQNTTGIANTSTVQTEILNQQISFLLQDLTPQATKTGALGSAANIDCTISTLSAQNFPIVVDPVFKSSSNTNLLDVSADELIKLLQNQITLCTPNITETEYLLSREVSSLDDMKEAARELADRLESAVLVTGGHIELGEAVDVFSMGERTETLSSPRIPGASSIHGTGCALSASITAFLAKGEDIFNAVSLAKSWLTKTLDNSVRLGAGAKLLYPIEK